MFAGNNKLNTEWLSKISFFDRFSESELKEVASLGQKVQADAGAVLADQGRFGDVSFVVVEGTANVSMNGSYVATIGAGTIVGEMSLIEHRPRVATVVAETDMVLVSFGMEEFRALLDRNPKAKEQILDLLEARTQANSSREQGAS